jgi:hypothetical protein
MKNLSRFLDAGVGGEVVTFGAPRAVISRLVAEYPGVQFDAKALAGVYSSQPSLLIGGFCFLKPELTRALPAFKRLLSPGGTLWVFWPKEAAWHAEDIRPEMGVTPEDVRACSTALGLQEADTCELDDVWTGVKFIHPTAGVP